MFVPVSNPKGAISCENLLHPYKKLNQKLTCDKALMLLSHTNFQRNIFDLLTVINKQNSGGELKEIVLACCDRRNPTERNLNLACSIAEKYHYEDELAQVLERNNEDDFTLAYRSNSEASVILPYDEGGRYYGRDWHQILMARQVILDGRDAEELAVNGNLDELDFTSFDEFHNFYDLNLEDFRVRLTSKVAFSDIKILYLGNCEQQGWKNVSFHHVEQLKLDIDAKLPEVFDCSGCRKVHMNEADCSALKILKLDDKVEKIELSHIPAEGFFGAPDLRPCKEVKLKHMDYSCVENGQFEDGASITLFRCSNLPEVLDLRRFSRVNIGSCADFNDVKEILFRDGAEVVFHEQYFSDKETMAPIKADFSKLSKVEFLKVFNQVPPEQLFQKIEFAEGAEVVVAYTRNVGKQMDFSRCGAVTFLDCNLEDVPAEHLQLAKGARVRFNGAENIPWGADISQCAEVVFDKEANLDAFQSLKFAKGTKVSFDGFDALPQEMDVSECAELWMLHIKKPLPQLDCHNVRVFTALHVDFSGYPLQFAPHATVQISQCRGLGVNTDFSNCKELGVDATDLSLLPKIKLQDGASLSLLHLKDKPFEADLSNLAYVHLCNARVKKTQKWNFADGAEIALVRVDGLVGSFNVKNCAKLQIEDCDVQNLTFQLEAPRELIFKDVSNLQNEIPNIPFHEADKVVLQNCDLLCTWDMRFKKGSQVMLDFQSGLIPPTLDVSECAEVGLYNLHRYAQPLQFAPHAKVAFSRSTLPKQVDVSQCAQVSFYKVDAEQTENLTFADNSKVEVHEINAWPKIFDASHVRCLKYKNCSLDGARGVLIGDNMQALQIDNVSDLPKTFDLKQTPLVLMTNMSLDGVSRIVVNNDYQRDMLVALNPKVKFKDKIIVRFPKEFATQMPPLKFKQSNKVSLKFAQTVRAHPKRGR